MHTHIHKDTLVSGSCRHNFARTALNSSSGSTPPPTRMLLTNALTVKQSK